DETVEILQGMKPSLARKAETSAGIDGIERSALRPNHIVAADKVAGLRFPLQQIRVGAGGAEQVSAQSGKIAGDVLGGLDFFDTIDRCSLALTVGPGIALAAESKILVVIIVHIRGKMGGRACGHAAADRPTLEHDHTLAGLRKFIRDR